MSTTPSDPPADESAPAPSAPPAAGSHLKHRAAAAVLIAASLAGAYFARSIGQPELQAVFGIPGFIGLAYLFSTAPNRVNWRTVVAGLALQFTLAFLILRVSLVYQGFELIGGAIQKFLDFTNEGASFVFGPMASAGHPGDVYGAIGGGPAVEISHNRIPPRPFLFAFQALPAVIFVSSFFTVLYHLGVLQFVVKWLARGVVIVMGTSGAETLSAVANVFMGQTEAPLIVKPYVLKMTRSELLALMVGGMATISGGVMVAYIGMMTAAASNTFASGFSGWVFTTPRVSGSSVSGTRIFARYRPAGAAITLVARIDTAPFENPAAVIIPMYATITPPEIVAIPPTISASSSDRVIFST
jgi:concentrative nucleoside transporter, CNT family